MTARELVKATNTKIRFIVFKEDADKKYPDKKVSFEFKNKDSSVGFGDIKLLDIDDLKNHYDIGYCLQALCWDKVSANYVAQWIDKTKVFKPDRFEIDFERKTMFVHLKLM